MVSVVLVIGALITSAVLIMDAHGGGAPALRSPQPAANATKQARLVIAGSGTTVPIVRRLVEAYRAKHPSADVIVHDSIGSTGAVRAVSDGVIHLGLLSRPLRDNEGNQLSTKPFARVKLVMATHPSVREASLSRSDLVMIYNRERVRWTGGQKIVVIQRERGDSGHRALARAIPELGHANERAWRQGWFRVVYSDRAMEAALLATAGAVGVADAGAIAVQRLPLRTYPLEGLHKQLAFVWRNQPSAAARAFFAFVDSDEGRAVLTAAGYEPVGATP